MQRKTRDKMHYKAGTKRDSRQVEHAAVSSLHTAGRSDVSALMLVLGLFVVAALTQMHFATSPVAADGAAPKPAAAGAAVRNAAARASLRKAESFAGIRDAKARSLALLAEAGKVITHPRCVNCHPAGDAPLQGTGEPHLPGAVRGEDGFGATAMRCATCHQAENYAPSGVPGHAKWQLAPREMAWQNKSLGEICVQIKDPKRNGGKDLPALLHHMAEDTLVGWGWHPGQKREPVPGTQAEFGALIAAWIASGAACPEP